MLQINPSTLQAARLAQGLSLTALASMCRISAATLSRIETGSRMPSSDEANCIAIALGMPLAALCRPLASARLGLSIFYHRRLSRAPAKPVARIENQCVLDAVALQQLTCMVDLDDIPVPEIDISEDVRGNPEAAADMLRLAWRVGRGPINNLCELLESHGCMIIHRDFGLSEVDAIYHKVGGLRPIFWANSRKPMERVRFSLAHELGHLVLHEHQPERHEQAEKQANEFASAFLMPRSDFRSECPSRLGISELIEMKRRWRCSMAAIAYRARDVGRISEDEKSNLFVSLSKRGWRKAEPYPLVGESPSLLAQIIRSAMDSLEMTEQALADHLLVPLDKIVAWQQPFPGQKAMGSDETPRLRLAGGY